MLQVTQDKVARLSREGVIEPSNSEWRSAPVLVRKPDGLIWFCVDYRNLNKLTRKDAYMIPSVDTVLDKLRHAPYITKIDLKEAYFQVPMEESSRKYTAFGVPGSGLWQFTRMPFGLTNAPMTFQRLIDAVFPPEYAPNVFGYLDDVIVVTDTFEDHLKGVELVLRKITDASLVVNLRNCEFCCFAVRYLGYLLDNDGLRPDPGKIIPMLDISPPRHLKGVRSFLGMINWCARFIEM